MEMKTEKIDKEKIIVIKNYSKRILRILISSLVGIIAGLGMLIVYIFWSMHFIPELSYNDTISSFPIISIVFRFANANI